MIVSQKKKKERQKKSSASALAAPPDKLWSLLAQGAAEIVALELKEFQRNEFSFLVPQPRAEEAETRQLGPVTSSPAPVSPRAQMAIIVLRCAVSWQGGCGKTQTGL